MTVVAFCEQLGIPRPTWYRWRTIGSVVKGPWPTPAQDAVEEDATSLASIWDAWGHRKLAELKRFGFDTIEPGPVSNSTMHRVLKRNGLSLPVNYTGETRQLAGVRRQAFIDPPTRRNRLWQADFSEFETDAQGVWNLGGVVDYWAKVVLACPVTVTKTTTEAIGFFEAALAQVEILLGVTWIEDLTDPDTGEIGKLILVTDNGPCFKSAKFTAWIAAQRHLTHVRTRKKSPWTNGQIERFFRSIKYEDLYRNDIADGIVLARRVENYLTVYNSVRPHEAIDMRRPLELYRQPPKPNLPDEKSVSKA